MKVNKNISDIMSRQSLLLKEKKSNILEKKNALPPITKTPGFHYVFPLPRVEVICFSFCITLASEKACTFIKWITFSRYSLILFRVKDV